MAGLTSLQTLNECVVIVDDSEGLKLGDLGTLDQLQGSLDIHICGDSKDAKSEALKACLSTKKLLILGISFSQMEEQRQVQVLEVLRPHQDLESLDINGHRGTAAPSWMISLQNLRSLTLFAWKECECLPPLGKLPFLEQLLVLGMEKVKKVGDEFLGTQTSSSSSSFPKLKKLTFKHMKEWEQWEAAGGAEITIMPCLVSLEIFECPKLMNLPLFLQNRPVGKFFLIACHRSIKMPVWPNNCDVTISRPIED